MQLANIRWSAATGWSQPANPIEKADLVLVFADAEHFHLRKITLELGQ